MNYQKLGAPYGDIYYVNTPNIDRVGAMMINDEKQRQRAQQMQAQDLDKEFAKNVSAIRDADVPEAVEKWGKYKQASIDLYKNENKLSNEERVAKQLEKQRLFADYMAHTNKSKLDKSDEEVALADWKKNTGNFSDDAHNFLLERRKTPLSKMQVTLPMLDKKTGKLAVMDMSDIYGNILYRNGTTDFTPIIQKATGKHELKGKPIDVISPDGLTTTTTQYKGLLSPNTIIGNLYNSVVGSKKTKDFPLENNYTDDQANDIILKYEKLKQTPEFKNMYPNEPDIPATLFQSSLGRAIALKAMESHVLNPPEVVVSKPFNNTGAVMDKRREDAMDDWLKKNKITDQQKRERIQLNKNGVVYEIDNIPFKLDKSTKSVKIITPDGQQAEQDVVDVTDWPLGEKDDIRGDKKNQWGYPVNNFIKVDGREYVKPNPDGTYTIGGNITVSKKDIIINTNKRTQGLEKPVGTGKADIRNSGSVVNTITTGNSGTKKDGDGTGGWKSRVHKKN